MTSTTLEAEVLKQDARGRVRVSVERREALLDEFERSGASAAKFARMAGIKYATFAGWVLKRRKRRRAPSAAAVGAGAALRLVEAVVESDRLGSQPAGSPGLLVELPGGSRLVVESPVQMQMAAELVALIAQRTRTRC